MTSSSEFTPLFAPKTVAVIGASTKGTALPERLHPPHPRVRLRGRDLSDPSDARPRSTACPRTRASPTRPSRSITRTSRSPRAQIPPHARGGATGTLRFAQVISSGFGEVDEGTRSAGRSWSTAARAGGVRLIGPNCLGIYTPRGKVTFAEIGPKEVGTVGVVSQSGGLGTDIIRRGFARGVKFSGLVTVGNCADVTPSDLLEFYLADAQTRVIGMYIETAKDGRRLFEILRERAGAKARGDPQRRAHAAGHRRGRFAHRLARRRRPRVGRARRGRPAACWSTRSTSSSTRCSSSRRSRRSPQHPTQRVVLFGNGGGTSVLATDYFARLGLDVDAVRAADHRRARGAEAAAGHEHHQSGRLPGRHAAAGRRRASPRRSSTSSTAAASPTRW